MSLLNDEKGSWWELLVLRSLHHVVLFLFLFCLLLFVYVRAVAYLGIPYWGQTIYETTNLPTNRGELEHLTGGVSGPFLGPLVGSRGWRARSAGVLDPLNAVEGLILAVFGTYITILRC